MRHVKTQTHAGQREAVKERETAAHRGQGDGTRGKGWGKGGGEGGREGRKKVGGQREAPATAGCDRVFTIKLYPIHNKEWRQERDHTYHVWTICGTYRVWSRISLVYIA